MSIFYAATRASFVAVVVSILGTSAVLAENWAVVIHDYSKPGQVAVISLDRNQSPWRVDSIWGDNKSAAWKKACWLAQKGDLVGRRFIAPQIQQGLVSCDANCNCRY